jgi:AAA domain, putative AbiEii toxin, Type IV TA system
MYISLEQIKQSLGILEPFHPFFGITFLVCKLKQLPVGSTIEFPVDAEERKFMEEYYKPDKSSNFYYRVFRTSDKAKRWLTEDYPSSGSQSVRTRGGFSESFIHEHDSIVWGWQTDYINHLKQQLKGRKIPLFHLVIWLFRSREWPDKATAKTIVDNFIAEFNITDEEIDNLFDTTLPSENAKEIIFSKQITTWKDLKSVIGSPPDARPDEGGTLTYLGISSIGPVSKADLILSERLNLLTGDNGLGKTFLLDCAWWALTSQWAGLPADPGRNIRAGKSKISFEISAEEAKSTKATLSYSLQTQSWPTPNTRPTLPGLLVYAKVDGSFAIWDPLREIFPTSAPWQGIDNSRQLLISKDEVWDGVSEINAGKTRVSINGLLRDWITWQNNPEQYPFDIFKRVLRKLSPEDLGTLEPGKPTRLPGDVRDIPTIHHSYGEVPILYASAGVRRIIALAYLVVWAWNEHRIQSELMNKKPQRRMVILIDEIEAHLHPKWQRKILPALIHLGDELSSELKVQFIVTTHSPLILVSIETIFEDSLDKLFHFKLTTDQKRRPIVVVDEMPYSKHGRIDTWLTSDIFEFKQARSQEAEIAIEGAKKLLLEKDPSIIEIQEATTLLINSLAFDDSFWPRWKYFVEKKGIKL